MFARASSAFVLALPVLAAAGSILPRTDTCDTGPVQCCQSTQQSSSITALSPLGILLQSLGVSISGLTGIVGSTCTPVTIVGGSSTCGGNQAVCCTNNNFNGAVVLGCTNIDIL